MIISDFLDIIGYLTANVLMLFAVVVAYSISNYEVRTERLLSKIAIGLVIGSIGIIILLNPFLYREGIMFDTRTVLLSLTAFYFSIETAIIASLITIGLRIHLGGSGVLFAIIIILTSIISGYIFKKIFKKYNFKNIFLKNLIVGISANIIILLLPLFINETFNDLIGVFLIYLTLFPIITVLLGYLVEHHKTRLLYNRLENAQMKFLQSSIDNYKTLFVFAVDKSFNYLTFNMFYKELMYNYYNQTIKVGDNLLKVVEKDELTTKILKEGILKALNGEVFNNEYNIDKFGTQSFKNHYYPIYENNKVVGATIYITNITDIRNYEQTILRISYYDALTNIPNRRYFQEVVEKLNTNSEVVSVITCDINGLRIINDAYGQSAGDELLVTVANELIKLSEDNNLFRVGGDEFIYLIKDCNLDKANDFVKEIDTLFKSKKIKGINVSVSCGIGIMKNIGELESAIIESEANLNRNKVFERLSHRSDYIKSILQTMEEKNLREKDHSDRVARICNKIGQKLKMSRHEINLLEAIAFLHDIGKIAIDEAILNKPGKLNDEEWEIIKTHPEIGYRIISHAPEYAEIAEDILSHHERYDGTGYPRGLKGDEIPIRARIIAIADAYDAMISNRPYRKALTKEEAIEEIKKCSGTQFDPKLVEIFLKIV